MSTAPRKPETPRQRLPLVERVARAHDRIASGETKTDGYGKPISEEQRRDSKLRADGIRKRVGR